jgi:hypothetical protein
MRYLLRSQGRTLEIFDTVLELPRPYYSDEKGELTSTW